MYTLKIVLAVLFVLSGFGSVLLVGRKRLPITPTQAISSLILAGLTAYALLN